MTADDEAKRRAERREAQWFYGVSASHEALDAEDFRRWRRLSGEERFRLAVELGRTLWLASHPADAPSVDFGSFGVRSMTTDE